MASSSISVPALSARSRIDCAPESRYSAAPARSVGEPSGLDQLSCGASVDQLRTPRRRTLMTERLQINRRRSGHSVARLRALGILCSRNAGHDACEPLCVDVSTRKRSPWANPSAEIVRFPGLNRTTDISQSRWVDRALPRSPALPPRGRSNPFAMPLHLKDGLSLIDSRPGRNWP